MISLSHVPFVQFIVFHVGVSKAPSMLYPSYSIQFSNRAVLYGQHVDDHTEQVRSFASLNDSQRSRLQSYYWLYKGSYYSEHGQSPVKVRN